MEELMTVTKELDVRSPAQQAHALRLAGHSWDAIAAQLDYASADSARLSVRNHIDRVVGQLDHDSRREMVVVELERLDAMHMALWDKAMTGDTKAIDQLLKVSDRRTSLLRLRESIDDVGEQTLVINSENFLESLKALDAENDADERGLPSSD